MKHLTIGGRSKMKEQIIKLLDGPIGKLIGMDKLWEAIDEYADAEVDRRIKERMPMLIKYWSRRRVMDDPDLEELLRLDDLFKSIYQANRRIDFGTAADMGMECVIKEIFRSRLTKNNSAELSQIKQINATENKQEGGEG